MTEVSRKNYTLSKSVLTVLAVVACASVMANVSTTTGTDPCAGITADSVVTDLGGMACKLAGSFKAIGHLMIGLAYISGIGFGIGAVFKFKQHKDNPTQIPIGTPFALLTISVLLVYLPSIYVPAGNSLFGTGAKQGGFSGAGWTET